jgi:MarR family transcriptional regulator, transcriptional regulator for hemolysin
MSDWRPKGGDFRRAALRWANVRFQEKRSFTRLSGNGLNWVDYGRLAADGTAAESSLRNHVLADDKHRLYKHAMSDSLGILITDSARLLRRRFDARARGLGVSRAQWQVLFALSRNEGINQAGLAEALDVETITVGRMVDRLEEAGLVERRADPADRRAWRLHLTPRAHPILAELRAVAEAVMAETLAGLGAEGEAQLAALLTRVRANLHAREAPGDGATPTAAAGGRR